MRFTRRDLPGIAIALLGGPALMLLFLASFETWDHRGTPTLGFMGANLGLAVGFAAIFARFIRNWDWPIAFLALLLAAVAAVNWAQRQRQRRHGAGDRAEVGGGRRLPPAHCLGRPAGAA